MKKIKKSLIQGPKINFVELFKPDKIIESSLNYEYYAENILDENNELYGHTDKVFVRGDSRALKSFLKSLNKEHSYITHFDDALKEGLIPKKVSILKKVCKTNDPNFSIYSPERESSASKILNFMGCPTPYNFAVRTEKSPRTYLASIDFIGYNEKFYSFVDCDLVWKRNISKILASIDNIFDKFEFNSPEEKQENLKKLKDEFMLSYLTRALLIEDGDFHLGNIGFLYNEKLKSVKFVNFDLEFPMQSDTLPEYYNASWRYIRKHHRNVYDKFIEKVSTLEKHMPKEQIYDFSEIGGTNHQTFMFCLLRNIDYIMRKHRWSERKEKLFKTLGFIKANNDIHSQK